MTASPFRFNGVDYKPLPSQGAYFGLELADNGKTYLVCVAMMQDGSPDMLDGEPNAVEVCNFDEDQQALDEVNALLGTSFPMSAFPGR